MVEVTGVPLIMNQINCSQEEAIISSRLLSDPIYKPLFKLLHLNNRIQSTPEPPKWEECHNLNEFTDLTFGFMRQIGTSVGIEKIVDKQYESVCRAREKRNRKEQEKLFYEGFLKPREIINLNNILSQIDALNEGQNITLTIHHPYHRKKIHEYCEKMGVNHKTKTDTSLELHDDSTLIYHFACKKCIPATTINWYDDLDLNGDYYQSQTICVHCDEHLLSNYEDDSDNDNFGYTKIHGHNTMVISKYNDHFRIKINNPITQLSY